MATTLLKYTPPISLVHYRLTFY